MWKVKCKNRAAGFTILELMIVMIIMAILLSIAAPIYKNSVLSAREAVLRNDLFELRKLISQYTLDKQKAPQSLDDLVQAGYLKQIPKDPMTNETNWVPQEEDVLSSVDQMDPGIDDVHSASNATGTDGTAYSSW
jgi:general secretion pathway protein G